MIRSLPLTHRPRRLDRLPSGFPARRLLCSSRRHQNKTPADHVTYGCLVLATSYSRTTFRRTTIGAAAFHFRVRNGNGWGHRARVTRDLLRRSEQISGELKISDRRLASVGDNGYGNCRSRDQRLMRRSQTAATAIRFQRTLFSIGICKSKIRDLF